jgi:hypothetical protein
MSWLRLYYEFWVLPHRITIVFFAYAAYPTVSAMVSLVRCLPLPPGPLPSISTSQKILHTQK